MTDSETNRRPIRVTLLALFILVIALWNGLRMIQAISFWPVLTEFQYELIPLYVTISGGVWFLIGAPTAWGLWRGKIWAWYATLGGLAGYASWYWFDRLVIKKPHANWPFALSITIMIIAVTLFILISPRTRSYFSKR